MTALCPGYVDTGFQEVAGMSLRGVESWSLVPVAKVAQIGVRAMEKGRREVIPGFLNKPIPFLNRMVPVRINLAIVKAMLMIGRP